MIKMLGNIIYSLYLTQLTLPEKCSMRNLPKLKTTSLILLGSKWGLQLNQSVFATTLWDINGNILHTERRLKVVSTFYYALR